MNVKHLLIITVIIVMGGCRSGKLPRAEATAEQKASFEQVFPLIWGEGTNELHALMVLKDDKVLWEQTDEGHTIDGKHVLWSASKTFTATAIGFAVQDGLLSVDDRMVDLIPDLCPEERNPWMDEVTVWHLLTMSSGIGGEMSSQYARRGDLKDWAREVLSYPMRFQPGTMFEYNSMGTYMLSVILTRVTGERLDNYLDRKLFKPLDITDWWWEKSPQDISSGGWGLFLSAESMAKMGLFMLHKGVWEGNRLLNEEWFNQAMSPQIMQYKNRMSEEEIAALQPAEWNQGYGFQMWCCTHGAYRLDGAWGQFCIIIPEKNAVVVLFSHTANTGNMLKYVWQYIYDVL